MLPQRGGESYELEGGEILEPKGIHELRHAALNAGSFEEWCKEVKERMPRIIRRNMGYMPMKQFIYDGVKEGWWKNQKNFPKTDNKVVVDYILRYETLEKDFNNMCEELGMGPFKLLELNKTNKCNDYRTIHTELTQQITEEIYKEDIETFGYKF